MSNNGGYIYVLTNPSFPEYVKIGYANNVDVRLNQLNRSECTPFAFRKYATLHVANRLADKSIHKIIDKFKPELRSKENINGKMRIREFFAMSAQEAVDLLSGIGGIYGEIPRIYEQSCEEKQDEKIAVKTTLATERRSPFSFYKCGIKNDEEIVYINDPSIICKVVGDREISFNGGKTSLSAFAKKLSHRNSAVQGTLYFEYKGEVLSALRKRLEDEGKYEQIIDKNFETETVVSTINDGFFDGSILYFVMDKYDAKCRCVENGYLLLKGSQLSSSFSSSCREGVKKLREQYKSIISKNYILLDDVLLKSSSTAAEFVGGSNKDGKLYWKNSNGVLLRDLLDKDKE